MFFNLSQRWRKPVRNNYFIKKGYRSRPNPQRIKCEDPSIVRLPYVYPFAAYLGKGYGCKYIIDVGCVNSEKLASLYPEFNIIGIAGIEALRLCRDTYNFGTWLEYDPDGRQKIDISSDVLHSSVIICSDIFEHLADPSGLLIILKQWMDHAPVCLMFTPERDILRGPEDMGPPMDASHVREWNIGEFNRLLGHYGFNVTFTGLTLDNSLDRNRSTLLSIVGNNNVKITYEKKDIDNFKVTAIIPAYNESDILYASIMKYYRQGIGVYVVEGWSQDQTPDILEGLKRNGIILGYERYPADGPTKYYEWKKVLCRIEELAKVLDSDWFIFSDVDEIRTSPWEDMGLKEAIYRVDKMGFNAIDHSVLLFQPTDNGFSSQYDFEDYLKYYKFDDFTGLIPQIKTWKNLHRDITLSHSGGHIVSFDGIRVCPYRFLVKHYPIRSQSQGDKKVFIDRVARWSPEEREMGWHIHYDSIKPGDSFIHKPGELKPFDRSSFYGKYLVERLSFIGIKK